MRIVLLDKREMFLADFHTQLLIDESDIELVGSSTSLSGLEKLLNESPDYVFVAENMVSEELKKIPGPYVGYRTENTGENPFEKMGIPSYNYIRGSEELLENISQNVPISSNKETVSERPEPETIEKIPVVAPTPQEVQLEIEEEEIIEVTTPETVKSTAETEESAKQSLYNMAGNRQVVESKTTLEKEIIQKPKKETKVVTAYAAKGGVGKTTISTALATYLSLVSEGRGYLRVCLIDCNIDFGDVISMLPYEPSPNLTYWADEVRVRLKRGEAPEDIVYTTEEIEERLQQSETGLFALIAPATHEDSMGIGTDEEKIIFDNIVKNGGFDYVICDTGNNTRSFSVLALDEADMVLFIQTQDISTASCNIAFLNTMKKLNYDTDKIFNVYNNLMSDSNTDLAIKDIQNHLPYPVLAQINYDMVIRRANNNRRPIVVSNPNHPFTKEIQKIAAQILGTNDIKLKKNGLFTRIKNMIRG